MAQWEGGGWHAGWEWVGLMDLGPGKAESRVLGKKETFLGESGKHWEPATAKGRGRGPSRGITRYILVQTAPLPQEP